MMAGSENRAALCTSEGQKKNIEKKIFEKKYLKKKMREKMRGKNGKKMGKKKKKKENKNGNKKEKKRRSNIPWDGHLPGSDPEQLGRLRTLIVDLLDDHLLLALDQGQVLLLSLGNVRLLCPQPPDLLLLTLDGLTESVYLTHRLLEGRKWRLNGYVCLFHYEQMTCIHVCMSVCTCMYIYIHIYMYIYIYIYIHIKLYNKSLYIYIDIYVYIYIYIYVYIYNYKHTDIYIYSIRRLISSS